MSALVWVFRRKLSVLLVQKRWERIVSKLDWGGSREPGGGVPT